jgi:hypothetical protein
MIFRMRDSIGADRGGVWPMFALDDIDIDSTGNPKCRIATGMACNKDSTLAFTTKLYTSKFADSADFYVEHFKVYKGPKNPTGTVTGVSIGFAGDWDIPGNGSINTAGAEPSLQMLYQQGTGSGASRFGSIAAFRADNNPITGGFVWPNDVYVYPNQAYVASDLWNGFQSATGMTASPDTKDFSSVLVIGRNLTINGANHDTLRFAVVLAGQPGGAKNPDGSLVGLKNTIEKAKKFISGHIAGSWYFPGSGTCGDANGDGSVNISDAVYLIAYIFSGGPAPSPLLAGDANCDSAVNISDAVYLIAYIFAGGPAPCAACK